jgi:PAS domain S-box-containing protein
MLAPVAGPDDHGGPGATARPSVDGWALFDSLSDVVILASADNIIRYANRAVEKLLGWAPSELVGRPLPTIMPARWRDQHTSAFSAYVSRGTPQLMGRPLRVPALRRDGTETDVELQLSEAPAPGEALVVGVLRPAGTRIDLERQSDLARSLISVLAEAGDLDDAAPRILEALARTLGWDLAMLWLVDGDAGGDTLTRQALWQKSGRSFPSLESASAHRSFPPGASVLGRMFADRAPVWISDAPAEPSFLRREEAAADGLHAAVAFPITNGDRFVGVVEVFSEEIRDPDRAVAEVMASFGSELGTFVERRRAEQARAELVAELRFDEALLRSQSDAGREGVLAMSPDGRVLFHNRRLLEMWGLDEVDFGSATDAAALAAAMGELDDPAAFPVPLHGVYDEPRAPSRDEIVMRDGRVIDRYGAPLTHADGDYFGWAWYFRDITEEKDAEQRLFESGERFAAVARTLQESLLPPDLPDVPGVELAARYHPAGGGIEVGGDFYDVFRTGRSTWGLVMGDVCGKGAPAARLTALARYTLRAAAMHVKTPSAALDLLNQAMLRQAVTEHDRDPERFATAVFATLRRARGRVSLNLSCAGHPPPMLLRADGRVEAVGRPGTLLGLLDEVDLVDSAVTLAPGDSIVLYTDGVTEARDEDGQLGEAGLRRMLAACAGASAKDVAEQLELGALRRQAGETRDDIAVLVVQVAG